MNAVPMIEDARSAVHRLFAKPGYRVTGCHRYNDAEGRELFRVARLKHPQADKIIRPMHRDGARYRTGRPERPATGWPLYVPPYPLVETEPVFVVEGEACADALARQGLTAVTSGSADSADTADWTPLQGRRVRLWPDHDGAGARYADKVEARLRALGCVVERIDVMPLNLPDKGDCVDWLQANPLATADDLRALECVVSPAGKERDTSPSYANMPPAVILRKGSSYRPTRTDWLWNGWLAAGKLAILGGQPGTGKTTIALALAATVTTGGRWPSGAHAERGSVAVWSGEDEPDDTLIPRLLAAGADVDRVHVVVGVRDGKEVRAFDPARDCDSLAAALAGIPDLRLLIVDPVVSAVAGDSHKNAEVRRSLQPLVDIASRHRCALLGITHFTKGTAGREPVERITGSLAFGALARLVLVTAKAEAKDGEPARRFLARAKSNIGPDGGGFAYDLEQCEVQGHAGVEASRVLWGAALEGSARELLASAETVEDEPGADSAGFLRELLHFGSRPAKEVFAEASAAGFSKDAMHRAKRKIGAVAVKDGMAGGWRWRLQAPEGSAEDGEGGAQNCPLSSPPSGLAPPSSGDEVEAFDL